MRAHHVWYRATKHDLQRTDHSIDPSTTLLAEIFQFALSRSAMICGEPIKTKSLVASLEVCRIVKACVPRTQSGVKMH